jgi:hypothetical protein
MFTQTGLNGVYYLVHFLHNGMIVRSTYQDVLTTYTDFGSLGRYEPNYHAASLVFALHFYHIAMYYRKFRFDDWLHHITMIFVALPIGVFVPASTLLGYSLFFTTGLPGCIDYLLLFLVRNGWLGRLKEKRANHFLNVWVRSPGCVSHAVITMIHLMNLPSLSLQTLCFIPAILNYWNGQYFMEQVVTDYAKQIPLFAGAGLSLE